MGIKKNFIFSTILTVSNYIFPFIIYPYVARVLGVNNIGICNYVDSIINYAIMLSMMGLAIIGVREIARAKHDRTALDTTFTSLCSLGAVFTVIATVALVTATYTLKELMPYRPLLLIGIVKLWGNFLLIDWLYRGLEDFKYITMRTILVKMGYLVCVFIFVRHASDYPVYFLLLCLMVAVNAVFNTVRAVRLVSLKFDLSATKALLRPFLALGVYLVLNSMYTTFNVIYLGWEWGDTEVGYYTTASKIFQLILSVYTAYSGVVMPRASSLLSERRDDEFRCLIRKSIDALVMISVPAVLFSMAFSPGIIYLMGGYEYTGSIVPMMIMMPQIFIIGYEQILVIQVLMPMSSDKITLLNSMVGASVGITLNFILVGQYGAEGSAWVWILSELSVLICAQYFVTRRVRIHFPARLLIKNIVAYFPFIPLAFLVTRFTSPNPIVQMLIGGGAMTAYFIAVQKLILKSPVFVELYDKSASFVSRFIRR